MTPSPRNSLTTPAPLRQPGRQVVTVTAVDRDQTAELRYQLVPPVLARDRAGVTVPTNVTDFSRWLA